jgi:DhnA family fructose-bisphosphate aldolase class Ia
MEDLRAVIRVVAAGNPDALLLTVGQAHWLQDLEQNPKPALVLRADAMNLYALPTPKEVFNIYIDDAVEQAVAWDAAAIVLNLFWMDEQPALHYQCVENILRAKPACERHGMPLMVEPMTLIPREQGGFQPGSDLHKSIALARLAVELGADIVKADIDANVNEYHRVVETAAPRPLLPRGGGKVSDREILARTVTLMQQGASGVVYGRNVYQHPHPQRMVGALKAVVHEGATVEQAMKILGESNH